MRTPMNEMHRLVKMLVQEEIPFEIYAFHVAEYDGYDSETWQIVSPSKVNQRVDAICHQFSYGGKDGLIEIMSDVQPDVVGWLEADEAIKYFREVNDG